MHSTGVRALSMPDILRLLVGLLVSSVWLYSSAAKTSSSAKRAWTGFLKQVKLPERRLEVKVRLNDAHTTTHFIYFHKGYTAKHLLKAICQAADGRPCNISWKGAGANSTRRITEFYRDTPVGSMDLGAVVEAHPITEAAKIEALIAHFSQRESSDSSGDGPDSAAKNGVKLECSDS